ncbi:hypothetical protein MNV49_003178 [Pseudohyphozyma bogoriensis]|nr:hypothetical protein MNV49_003178 [Pseudohyphozyma bogoriensis]
MATATATASTSAAPPPATTAPNGVSSVPFTTLTTRAEIEEQLTLLTYQESTLDQTLASLISSRQRLASQLSALQGLREVVDGIEGEAEHMAREVRGVAETADRVGGKVRVLDEEQSRVKASIEVVQAVQDLKSSIASLSTSIAKQDWETATRFMQRATALDPEIVASRFAEAVVPTSDLPTTPPQTIANIRASLLETFLTAFRAAAGSGDTNNINRFFKLFPMIGEEETGLDVYAEWVGGIVRNKAGGFAVKSQSPTHFSTLLTSLFESIALIISQHQPVVEKYYGGGKMLVVAGKLLDECDRLGGKVVKNWEEERRIRRKVRDAGEYTFPGLSVGGRKKAATGPGAGMVVQADEEKVDAREIDALLAELALMSGRWQLLRRFLYGRLKEDEEPATPAPPAIVAGDDPPPSAKTLPPPEEPPAAEGEGEEEDLPMVEQSALAKTLNEHLQGVYEPMEIWYLRSSVEKAHQMDELDLQSQPSLSSSLDDVFYILKKTLYRLLSTSSITTMVRLTKEVRAIVERDVAEVWRGKMDGAFKDVGAVTGGGRAREEEKDRREKEAKAVFIIYLNNLDTAAEYTVRLMDEMLSGDALNQTFFVESELERARIALVGVKGVEDKFRSVLKSGLDHLFNQLLRPRLRPLLSEVYKDVSYVLDEEAYAEAEYRDDVRKRFVKSWEALLAGYRESFTPTNFNLFFATAVNVLVRPWEGMIRGMKFTELGALRFDRDIRSILSYLSSQSSYASGSLRESFSRLQQIATLLTLDSPEEAEEVLSATGNRLTQSEVKVIWGMRV